MSNKQSKQNARLAAEHDIRIELAKEEKTYISISGRQLRIHVNYQDEYGEVNN